MKLDTAARWPPELSDAMASQFCEGAFAETQLEVPP
jgi:hypothetical protein